MADPFSFAAMRRCEVPGCEWQVVSPRNRCRAHRSPDDPQPSYEYSEGVYGELVGTRGWDPERVEDCGD